MDVGQKEYATQKRIIKLFQDVLHYEYLGDWSEREGNSNVEESLLRAFLVKQGYKEILIKKAINELVATSHDQIKSLYNLNKSIYTYLRYGVQVKPDVGENNETVWLIDWNNPLNNHFAIAEEVTISGPFYKRPDIVLYVNGIALGVLELITAPIQNHSLQKQKGPYMTTFERMNSLLFR